jgi:CheY-like chemotaxis protein
VAQEIRQVPKTLLVVDDSATMRKVLEITFSGDEFRVITADGSAAALGRLGEDPRVVLIDTALGADDGYALCREIRRRDPSATIVLLASRHNPYDAAQGRDAGADDFMDKPFDTQQMLDKVRKAIQAREAGAAAASIAPPQTPLSPATPQTAIQRPQFTPSVAAQRPPAPSIVAPDRARARTLMFGDRGQPVDMADSESMLAAPKDATPPPVQPATLTSGLAGQAKPSAAIYPPLRSQPVVSRKPEPPAPPAQTTPPTPVVLTPVSIAPVAQAAPAAAPDVKAPSSVLSASVNGQLAGKLGELGLSPQQADAVMALSREVVEKVVWEVVPQLAEMLIKEEIARLTKEG